MVVIMKAIRSILTDIVEIYKYPSIVLAEEIGASVSSIHRWMHGKSKPRPLMEGRLRELHSKLKDIAACDRENTEDQKLSSIDEWEMKESVDATLAELREILHRRGRLSSRNEALDEISKLFFAYMMSDGGISTRSFSDDTQSDVGIAEQLRQFVRDTFERHLPTSLHHEIGIADFELKLRPDEDTMAKEVVEAFENLGRKSGKVGVSSLKKMDVLNEVFGKFLADSFVNEKELGQYLTPPEVVRFMVSLAIMEMSSDELETLCNMRTCKEFGLVLDPSCGVGSFMIEFLRRLHDEVRNRHGKHYAARWAEMIARDVLVGVDKSERMVRLALTNMATFGVPMAQIHLANSLARSGSDSIPMEGIDEQVGLILTNPPFGAEFGGDDIRAYSIANQDRRQAHSRINSELLFMERYVDWLRPGGQLIAIIPDSILTNRGIYEELRNQLSDQIEVCSVISLPGVTFAAAGTSTKTSILHVRKLQGTNAGRDTFFAICEDIGYSVRTVNAQRTKTSNGNGRSDLVRILEAFTGGEAEGKTKRVNNLEHSRRWDANYHVSLPSEIQRIVSMPSFDDIFLSTVAELSGERADPRRWGTGTFKYIEISDIDPGTCMIRPKTVACVDAPSRARKIVKAGDVLFSTVRPERKTVGVVMGNQEGSVCSTGLAVLRPVEIPSLVLAQLLKTEFVLQQIMRNTIGIAYPAIDEQCLLDILLPIQRDKLRELQDAAGTLIELERRIEDKRNDFSDSITDAIEKWSADRGRR